MEGKPSTLSIDPLPYGMDELSPAISKDTLEYHFNNLAKTYAKRYNAGEGDATFNEAGVFLHNILFKQYQEPSGSNKPDGKVLELIDKHYGTFDKFKISLISSSGNPKFEFKISSRSAFSTFNQTGASRFS